MNAETLRRPGVTGRWRVRGAGMARRGVAVGARVGALAVVVVAIGLLPWLSGRDPALSVLRARSAEQDPTPEAIAAVRAELGLDAGPLTLLTRWFGGVVRGDLGTSWANGADVLPSVLTAAGASLTLMGAALGIAVVIAAAICVPTLVRGARGTLGAKGNGVVATGLAALPEFLLATVLMLMFAVWLGWLPPYGWEGPQHLILPALALALPAAGILGRLVDDALPAVFAERWVSLWRSAGCTPAGIAAAAVRRATPAVVPQLGLVAVGLTGGAVAVETVFAIPGIGRTALGAAESQDLPVLQGSVLALILLGVAAGALAHVARRRLLGPGLRDQALNLPVAPPTTTGRRQLLVPIACAVVLATTIGWGLTLDPLHLDTTARLASPTWDHPLGTDSLGRDVLARVGHGAAGTIGTAGIVCAASFVIALAAGLHPAVTEGVSEIANAVPPVIAGILVAAVLGPGTLGASIAVALVSWPPLAAHAAALTQETKAAAYLTAQKAIGAGRTWILTRHVLPAVVGPVARHAVLRLPGIALALASLGFLGLGAQPPAPEWGSGLAESLPYVERAPWAALAPTIMLLVLAALAVSVSTVRRK